MIFIIVLQIYRAGAHVGGVTLLRSLFSVNLQWITIKQNSRTPFIVDSITRFSDNYLPTTSFKTLAVF